MVKARHRGPVGRTHHLVSVICHFTQLPWAFVLLLLAAPCGGGQSLTDGFTDALAKEQDRQPTGVPSFFQVKPTNKTPKLTACSMRERPGEFPGHAQSYISTGLLIVHVSGGFGQQRKGIVNAVLLAYVLNATLVMPPILDEHGFWKDNMRFDEVYDQEHFVNVIKEDIQVEVSIPAHLRDRRVHKYHSNQMKHSLNESDIVRELLPLLQAHGALQVLNWHKQPTNIMAPHLQRLRCRANFHALRYIPEIMRIAELVVQELRRAGTFFAVHLRFEADWMVHYACSFNTTTLRTQEDPSGPRMRPCLLTPGEVALILKAVGADQDTTVYLASGEIFEAKVSMTPFLEQLPKTVRREAILQRLMINESLHINSTLVETHGWIIDYVVSVERYELGFKGPEICKYSIHLLLHSCSL
eukprot:TRINITY_DN1718_c0_g1_i5.p1 TRINITY_DN1718_c0_g1~~TRINITY_DN1718_c0_g1_i5.p1  ORF type:complete len:413 (-),score=25.46 TRINITY_DN1718_c0_g1_i5:14-1252(-)